MSNSHPYLKAYLKTNCKFDRILKHYRNIQNQNNNINNHINYNNQNAGGGKLITEIDNFIFEENYDDEDERISIFIGKKYECVIAFIDKQTPNLVWLEYFSYNQNCNINKNLIHGEGTFNMMSSFIKYIKQKHPHIKMIKLSDKSEFTCSNIRISLYKLYMLKYGKSFYEQKFGFIIDDTNHPEIISIHNKNIQNSKTIKIDKEFITEELNKLLQIKDTLYKPYLTPELIDEFTSNLENNELVREFILRFKIPNLQCAIFEDFLNIIFGNYNLDRTIIEQGAVYIKYIDVDKDKQKSKKLTKKKITSSSSNLIRKLSLKSK